MSLTRATTCTSRYCNRHLVVLKSFISLAGVPLDVQPLLPTGRPGRFSVRRVGQFKTLSSTALTRTSNISSPGHSDGVVDGGVQSSAEGANDIYPSVTNAAPIPWYLQIDTPQAPVYPVSDRQRLPDMPDDPPPLLKPLLKYVSIDLGLDDLSLFDLRKLDPPPALGSNLLMILGTARSGRHLHVSADRLCRWLRSTYRLTPFADGLLGRNELKLKMRRKARKAKLLGTFGTSASNNADDGVRTGWVCVNVGTVEGGKASQEDTAAMPEIVGFGSRSTGVKIVIQMLTEEKRGELELEELWGGMLKGQVQSHAVAMDHAQEIPNSAELRLANQVSVPVNSNHTRVSASFHSQLNLTSRTQIRALHSERKVFDYDVDDINLDRSSGWGSTSVETKPEPMVDEENLPRAAALSVSGREDQDLVGGEHKTLHHLPDNISIQDHFKYLVKLKRDAGLKALGQDINDTSSTPFLISLYTKLSESSDELQWRYRLRLLSCGMKLGHDGYPKSHVTHVLKQIQASSTTPTRGLLISMLRLTAVRNERGFATQSMSPADLIRSVQILDEMSRHGYKKLPQLITVRLRKATQKMTPVRGSAEGELAEINSIRLSPGLRTVQQGLSNLLTTFKVDYISEAQNILMLRNFAKENDWESFWCLWEILPKWRSRSRLMYVEMFTAVAESRMSALCVESLRKWVPAMDMEGTPVKLEGAVAEAVKRCLLVVQPNMGEYAQGRSAATGEWVSLWVQCQSGPQKSPVRMVKSKPTLFVPSMGPWSGEVRFYPAEPGPASTVRIRKMNSKLPAMGLLPGEVHFIPTRPGVLGSGSSGILPSSTTIFKKDLYLSPSSEASISGY